MEIENFILKHFEETGEWLPDYQPAPQWLFDFLSRGPYCQNGSSDELPMDKIHSDIRARAR